MEIVDNKALLLKLRNPSKITTVIPKSKQLDAHRVLVRWGVDETQVLRNLGIEAPSPIEGAYDWPGRYKPFAHQKVTAAFLSMNRRAYCFSQQGTGKTGAAIWASDFLLKTKKIRRVLVVCPLSIMDAAWKEDLFSFAMHRRVDIAHGSRAKRAEVINGDADYVIINYDGVGVVRDEIANGGFDLIIVDEANMYKNPQTTRWKMLSSVVGPDTWVWMMTGTPAAQSPVDAYGLAKLMNPNSVPRYAGTFRDQVMFKVSQFRWIPKEGAAEIVHQVLQPAIRYTKEECLDLPDMSYTRRSVPLTSQQNKYYKELKDKMVTQAAGEEITAHNAAIVMNKLLQISCGAAYTDDGATLEFDVSNRYKVLQEVINETSNKALVFVPFRNAITLLKAKLAKDKIPTEVVAGGVPAARRAEIFKAFQEKPDPKVLLIQPQAAAHGVTLTAADTVVWWGPVSSLETYEQANARVHRAGQRNPCTVVQLQGSEVEKHIYSMLSKRIDVHTKLVDLYKQLLD